MPAALPCGVRAQVLIIRQFKIVEFRSRSKTSLRLGLLPKARPGASGRRVW